MDTRKAEDPRTLAIASKIHEQMPAWIATSSTSVFAVVGMLHDIWSRCMELETETLTASPEQLEEWYGYPKGFIKAMEQVGWAKVGKGSVTIHTRNQQAQEQRRMREERARAGGLAKAAKRSASGSASVLLTSARGLLPSATDRQTERHTDRHTGRADAPPSGGEGGGLSPAAAMREVLRSSTPRTGRNPDVLAQLRTLSDQTNGSQPELTDGTHGSVEAVAAGGG
jgi:hypothetical protein